MNIISRVTEYIKDRPAAVAVILIAPVVPLLILRGYKAPGRQPRAVIPSPRTTLLPKLTSEQQASLDYPPNALPGARDVKTLYGTMRVYEWGPVDGKKVVFVHGDATPSPLFATIAKGLASRGCRVMALDLWGRGYSDTPVGVQHDSRLYGVQILFALASSSIPWVGSENGGFALVAFSMGCSISLDFFAHNAAMVTDLVLLGPGGLIRKLPAEYLSPWFQWSTLLPHAVTRRLLAATLGVELRSSAQIEQSLQKSKASGFTPAGAVQWQFDHHQGHLQSFLSNILYGPIVEQWPTWRAASDIVTGRSMAEIGGLSPAMGKKVLVICGEDDTVVLKEHVREDTRLLFGDNLIDFHVVPGDHGFPWPEANTIVGLIANAWYLPAEV